SGLVGPNQETAPGRPIAELTDYRAPLSGIYYLQVTLSGSQHRATYRLEADGLGSLGGVDLAASNLRAGPGVYRPEDLVRVGFTLSNLGADPATTPSYAISLGKNPLPDAAADLKLGTFSLSKDVAPGEEL